MVCDEAKLGETTDVDFFSPELQNTGLIQKSRGEALAGRPRSLGYIGDYAYLDEEKGSDGQG